MNGSEALSSRTRDLASREASAPQHSDSPWLYLRPYSPDTGVLESRGRDSHPMAWRLTGAPARVPPDTLCARCGKELHPAAGDWMYDDPVPGYVCAGCAASLLASYRSG